MSADAGSSDTATGELLVRARRGDWFAEKRLFDVHRKALANEAARHRLMPVLSAAITIDDVVADVWLRCYSTNALASFEDRGSGSLLRFLRVVLERVMIDHLRRLSAERRGGAETMEPLELFREDGSVDGERGQLSREQTPTSRARQNELMELCRAVLDGDEFAVWHAVEYVGCDTESVAASRGCSAAAVRRVLDRVHRKLMRALEARSRPDAPE
jgi:RNA polymerase sigma factor (sigma-70 family)